MNLQQFLEEEIIDFSIDFGHARNCDLQPPNDGEQMCSCGYEQLESAVKNINTRLINKVLDEVKREVEKMLTPPTEWKECVKAYHNNEEYCMVCGFEPNKLSSEISTIIDNLKLK